MRISASTRKFLINIGALLSGSMIARAISAVSLVITARILGPTDFGPYVASLSFARIASVFFTLGLNGWLLQRGFHNRGDLRIRATAVLSLVVVLGLIWILCIALIAPFFDQETFTISILILCAISVWFEEISNMVATVFKAALLNQITMIYLASVQVLLLLCTVFFAWRDVQSVEPYLWGRVFSMCIGAIVGILFLFRKIGFQLQLEVAVRALRETKSFAVSSALGSISRQADILIVAHWLGATATGLYATAITLASTLFLIPASIYSVVLPMLGQLYDDHIDVIRERSAKLLLGVSGLGILLIVVQFVLAIPLVHLVYGEEYAESGILLQIFSFILGFRCVSVTAAAILDSVRWQKRRVTIQALVVILNICLNLLVVNTWGISGVAWVYVISETVLMVGYLGWVGVWRQKTKAPIVV